MYVHNTFFLQNVLSPKKCNWLILATEMAGYCHDEPFVGQPSEFILATHAFGLLITKWNMWFLKERRNSFHHLCIIFERVQEFLLSYLKQRPIHAQWKWIGVETETSTWNQLFLPLWLACVMLILSASYWWCMAYLRIWWQYRVIFMILMILRTKTKCNFSCGIYQKWG